MISLTVGRRVLAGVFVALAACAASQVTIAAAAKPGKCAFCRMDVLANTATTDNVVTLTSAKTRMTLRCVYCALAEAQEEEEEDLKGNLTITAPTERKGKLVTIRRANGKWSVTPRQAVFVGAQKLNHKHCEIDYRAVTSRKAVAAYVKKHKNFLGNAKVLTLKQLLDETK